MRRVGGGAVLAGVGGGAEVAYLLRHHRPRLGAERDWVDVAHEQHIGVDEEQVVLGEVGLARKVHHGRGLVVRGRGVAVDRVVAVIGVHKRRTDVHALVLGEFLGAACQKPRDLAAHATRAKGLKDASSEPVELDVVALRGENGVDRGRRRRSHADKRV
jgi:hypothetical protein